MGHKCNKCGFAANPPKAKYCGKCGSKLLDRTFVLLDVLWILLLIVCFSSLVFTWISKDISLWGRILLTLVDLFMIGVFGSILWLDLSSDKTENINE